MMMSVLQEIKGLTKELYFIILSRRKSSFHAKFQVHWLYVYYLFWHKHDLHYNVLSGLIIIIFSRSKRVKGKIMCLCTNSDENLFKSKISGSKLLWLLRYASSWRRWRRICEIMFYPFISYLVWYFHWVFCIQLLFLHVFHLDVIKRQIEIETES